MKKLTPKQFRELGFLQELNRQFLHPLGLSLEIIDHGDGTETFGNVWDCQDDPEGIIFDKSSIDETKIKFVKLLQENRHASRKKSLGFIIQDIEHFNILHGKSLRRPPPPPPRFIKEGSEKPIEHTGLSLFARK